MGRKSRNVGSEKSGVAAAAEGSSSAAEGNSDNVPIASAIATASAVAVATAPVAANAAGPTAEPPPVSSTVNPQALLMRVPPEQAEGLAQVRAAGLAGLLNGMSTLPGMNLGMLPLMMMQRLKDRVAHAPPEPVFGRSNEIDPDCEELCEHFNIEDRICRRLSDVMRTRQDTFAADMAKLWEVLESARVPAGLLMVKIKEMEDGVFVGKAPLDPELKALVKRFKLDEQAKAKLADVLARRPDTRKDDIKQVEKHLATSSRPSAMTMMLLGKFKDGERLPDPDPKWEPVAAWSSGDRHGDRDRRGDRDRSRGDRRGRSRDRDRERERGRDRGRDRGRGRDRNYQSRSRSRR